MRLLRIDAREVLEELFHVLLADAHAGIADRDVQRQIRRVGGAFAGHEELDLALPSVFHAVVQEIHHDLLDADAVAGELVRQHRVRLGNIDQPLFRGTDGDHVIDIPQHLP